MEVSIIHYIGFTPIYFLVVFAVLLFILCFFNAVEISKAKFAFFIFFVIILMCCMMKSLDSISYERHIDILELENKQAHLQGVSLRKDIREHLDKIKASYDNNGFIDGSIPILYLKDRLLPSDFMLISLFVKNCLTEDDVPDAYQIIRYYPIERKEITRLLNSVLGGMYTPKNEYCTLNYANNILLKK